MTAAILIVGSWPGVARATAAACTGWSGFQAPVRYSSSADQVVLVRDLDGDGAPEILTSGNHVDELAAFSLLVNRGDGTFAGERLVQSGFGERVEDVGDLDGDGIPDLLASDYWSNGIAVHLGRGSLQFGAPTAYETATHSGPSQIVDDDDNGTPDVVSFSFGSGNPVRARSRSWSASIPDISACSVSRTARFPCRSSLPDPAST